MIDIENIVLDHVANAVYAAYPNASVEGEYTESPTSFPCVTVVESDNYIHDDSIDCTRRENNVRVMYSIDVYTNDSSMRKDKAKRIAAIVDDVMLANGFVRSYKHSTPNIDRTIYRITMRYTGIVGSAVADGDNEYYPIYR